VQSLVPVGSTALQASRTHQSAAAAAAAAAAATNKVMLCGMWCGVWGADACKGIQSMVADFTHDMSHAAVAAVRLCYCTVIMLFETHDFVKSCSYTKFAYYDSADFLIALRATVNIAKNILCEPPGRAWTDPETPSENRSYLNAMLDQQQPPSSPSAHVQLDTTRPLSHAAAAVHAFTYVTTHCYDCFQTRIARCHPPLEPRSRGSDCQHGTV
jgi:hypothetical protein